MQTNRSVEGIGNAPDLAVPAEPVRILIASPVGRLGIEFIERAVTRVIITPKRSEARQFKTLDKIDTDDFLDETVGRLSEYFAGARTNPRIDVNLKASGIDTFSRRVLRETLKIPYGRTWTYKRLAEVSGRPEAYRQVRGVLVANPIPILVPCHRVTPSKGGIGTYVAGIKKKAKLLKLEERVLTEGTSA